MFWGCSETPESGLTPPAEGDSTATSISEWTKADSLQGISSGAVVDDFSTYSSSGLIATLCRQHRRHRQRRHALRPPPTATALLSANRTTGQFVCHRNSTPNRSAKRPDTIGRPENRHRTHRLRQKSARRRTRQTILGKQTSENT